MRQFDDYDATRQAILDNVISALSTKFPVENETYRLELTNIRPTFGDYSIKAQKDAILKRKDLSIPIKGTFILRRKDDNSVVDQRSTTIFKVPYLTQRGTFILDGNEATLANQMRLRPGVFARIRESGEPEAHVNVIRGGMPFRIYMEPETSVFRIKVGQSAPALYPLLKKLGVSDKDIEQWWGKDIYAANAITASKSAVTATLNKILRKLSSAPLSEEELAARDKVVSWDSIFGSYELDPEVTKITLGNAYSRVQPETIRDITQKLIKISRGEGTTDDRDSLLFQEVYGPEDLISERILKDAGGVIRKMLWDSTRKGKLAFGPGGQVLNQQLDTLIQESGLAQYLEETNPLDAYDQATRLTRLGEGGIEEEASVPLEARSVQPTYTFFIDPIRTPESSNIGVDLRTAYGVKKGPDKRIYTPARDVKTGKLTYINSIDMLNNVVAFPGELERARKTGDKAKVMWRGEMHYVDPDQVQYEIPSYHVLFNPMSLFIPMISASKGGRLLMGSRVLAQALPLEKGESPLVRPADESGTRPFYSKFMKYLGAVTADIDGVVKNVSDDAITVLAPDGTEKKYELYKNFIFNRKTYINNVPIVKPGDVVTKGKVLARSNYTDDEGNMAMGVNLRVGYMPFRGLNYEDAIVISDEAAKKLTSEHMYQEKLDLVDELIEADKPKFIALYPSMYTKEQLDKIDDNGVVKPGTVVEEGDPIILATERKAPKATVVFHGKTNLYRDKSITWDKKTPGIVTDVWRDRDGIKVAIMTKHPVEVGDKLTNFAASKGVVSAIIPADKMPRDSQGRPLEIIMNPLSVLSRGNPSQVYEALLGKIAEIRGQPYVVPSFTEADYRDFVKNELAKYKVSDTEDLYDPENDKTIPKVLTGKMYFVKLHHLAASKLSSRGLGAYSTEGIPTRLEDEDNPKRIGLGEMQALLSHGAVKTIKDAKMIRGQRNTEYWSRLMMGQTPAFPETPDIYKKFIAMLRSAGINVKRTGNDLQLLALTDKDIESISRGEITNPTTVKWEASKERGLFNEKSLEPVEGGLFDVALTGGHGGNYFAHISLSEPMPNPVMENSIKLLLGLNTARFDNIVSGKESLGKFGSGGGGLKRALAAINVDQEIERTKEAIKTASSYSAKDALIRKLKILDGLKATGVKPEDLVVTKVAVLPPIFRPITSSPKFTSVSSPNLLYMDLMNASTQLAKTKETLTDDKVHEARLNLYKSFKALVGLGDPIKAARKQQSIQGILREVFGDSPKMGLFQRKLLGTPADLSGRAAITPNPDLNIDQIGLPEEQAWELYAPFVVRRLIRSMGNVQGAKTTAIKLVDERHPRARAALLDEMAERPVIASRAPYLHRYSVMGFMPVLSKSNTIELPPPVTEGFNADFDGDAMNFHVVSSPDAIKEVKEKMLASKNLRGIAKFSPMYLPRHEFLLGLYLATRQHPKGSFDSKLKFKNVDEVMQLYKKGKLPLNAIVEVETV